MKSQYKVINGKGFVPEGTTMIDNCAFSGNQELKEMVIPDSVRVIGDFAFRDTGLEKIKIPSSIARIGVGVFSYCPNLTQLKIDDNNPYYHSHFGDAIIETEYNILIQGCNEFGLHSNVTTIGKFAFAGCKRLKTIVLPQVTRIEENAFIDCTNLECVVLPNSLRTIGDYAFSDCCRLTKVYMPDGIIEIGDNAFYGCSDLKSITIPDSVERIGKKAFDCCFNLEEITISDESLLKDADVPPQIEREKMKECLIQLDKELETLIEKYLSEKDAK